MMARGIHGAACVAVVVAAFGSATATLNKMVASQWASQCCQPGGCSECPCTTLDGANASNATAPRECQCECAEFVSDALKHGGYDDGHIIWVPSLFSHLNAPGSGWKFVSKNPADVRVADVIIYQTPEGPMMHTCIGAGNGVVNCHNNNHCGISANLGYPVNGIFTYVGGGGGGGKCKKFVAGLCPGGADCMCTQDGATCSADDVDKPFNKSLFIDPKTGGCTGHCRQVVHGQCPGGDSCLNDVGDC